MEDPQPHDGQNRLSNPRIIDIQSFKGQWHNYGRQMEATVRQSSEGTNLKGLLSEIVLQFSIFDLFVNSIND